MAVADLDDLIEQTVNLMGGTADDLSMEAKELSATQAMSELGWQFPLATGHQSYWGIERTRRHLLHVLVTAAAMKFQYKQIHLEHRFNHLSKLIKDLDTTFLKFVEENSELFSNVLSTYDDFCYYVTGGFEYDPTGLEL